MKRNQAQRTLRMPKCSNASIFPSPGTETQDGRGKAKTRICTCSSPPLCTRNCVSRSKPCTATCMNSDWWRNTRSPSQPCSSGRIRRHFWCFDRRIPPQVGWWLHLRIGSHRLFCCPQWLICNVNHRHKHLLKANTQNDTFQSKQDIWSNQTKSFGIRLALHTRCQHTKMQLNIYHKDLLAPKCKDINNLCMSKLLYRSYT